MDFMVPDLVGSLNFIGSCTTFPKEGQEGQIIAMNDSAYVWTHNHWTILEELQERDYSPKQQEIVHYQCRNCGAPTNEYGRCAYCGTINREFRKLFS